MQRQISKLSSSGLTIGKWLLTQWQNSEGRWDPYTLWFAKVTSVGVYLDHRITWLTHSETITKWALVGLAQLFTIVFRPTITPKLDQAFSIPLPPIRDSLPLSLKQKTQNSLFSIKGIWKTAKTLVNFIPSCRVEYSVFDLWTGLSIRDAPTLYEWVARTHTTPSQADLADIVYGQTTRRSY